MTLRNMNESPANTKINGSWRVSPVSETVAKLIVDYERNQNWEFKILISADRHLDSKHSDLRLQKKHLNEAKANNWPVLDIGDMMDAMQGAKDPRACRSELLPFLSAKDEYFDAVVDYAYDFVSPYARQFALITPGNHETSVLKHNNTNLPKRLVKRMKTE